MYCGPVPYMAVEAVMCGEVEETFSVVLQGILGHFPDIIRGVAELPTHFVSPCMI